MNSPIKPSLFKLQSPESNKFIPIELSDDNINESINDNKIKGNKNRKISFSKYLNFDNIEPIINNKESNEKNNSLFINNNSLDNSNNSFKNLIITPIKEKEKNNYVKLNNNKLKCQTDQIQSKIKYFFEKKPSFKFIKSIKINKSEKKKIKIKEIKKKTAKKNNKNQEKTKGKIIRAKTYNVKNKITINKTPNLENNKNSIITRLRKEYNNSMKKENNKNPLHEIIQRIKKSNFANSKKKLINKKKKKNKNLKITIPYLTENKNESFEFDEKITYNIYNTVNNTNNRTIGRYSKLERVKSNRIIINKYYKYENKKNKKFITKNSSRSHSKTSLNTNSTTNSNFLPQNKRKIQYYTLSIISKKNISQNKNNKNCFLNKSKRTYSLYHNYSNYFNTHFHHNNYNNISAYTSKFKLNSTDKINSTYKNLNENSTRFLKGNIIENNIKAVKIIK